MSNQHRMIARACHLFNVLFLEKVADKASVPASRAGVQRVALSSSMVSLWLWQRRWCQRLATSTRPVEQLQETV